MIESEKVLVLVRHFGQLPRFTIKCVFVSHMHNKLIQLKHKKEQKDILLSQGSILTMLFVLTYEAFLGKIYLDLQICKNTRIIRQKQNLKWCVSPHLAMGGYE